MDGDTTFGAVSFSASVGEKPNLDVVAQMRLVNPIICLKGRLCSLFFPSMDSTEGFQP